jgi:hypothetical protein
MNLKLALRISFAATAFLVLSGQAAELNKAAISYSLPKDIKWVENNGGSAQYVVSGDPSKPGMYVVLTRWHPGHMSHPHFHPNDRFISVLSGTWYVGTGSKWGPEYTVGLPAGSIATHFAKEVHWDGAKDEEVTLMIVGMGPATSTSVPETK